MVKLFGYFTLALAALTPIAQATAVAREVPVDTTVVKRGEIVGKDYDPWALFVLFNWNTWNTWGWYGYDVEYVKDWYYDTYGYSLPPGVWSWVQLSQYVSAYGTRGAKPATIVAYTTNAPNPWAPPAPSSSSSSASKSASTTSSSSSTASSSTSTAKPGSSTSSVASSTSSSSSSSSTSKAASSSSSSSASATVSSSTSSSTSSTSSKASSSSSAAASSGSSSSSSAAGSSSSSSSAAASSSSSSSVAASSSSSSSSSSSRSASSSSSSSVGASSSSSSSSSSPSSASSSSSSSSSSTSSSSAASSSSSSVSTAAPSSSSSSASSTTSSSTSSASPSPTIIVPTIQGWMPYNQAPCIQEGVAGRALTGYTFTNSKMTPELCTAACEAKGLPIAGIEYGIECYCGRWLSNAATVGRQGVCSINCGGNSTVNCGGYATLSMWVATTSIAANLNYDLSRPNSDVTLPRGWYATSVSCIAESTRDSRALTGAFYADDSMTIAMCLEYCGSKGMPYAGLEYARECLCGSDIVGDASLSKLPSPFTCDMPCLGNPSQTCGGMNAIQLYKNAAYVPTMVNNFTYTACLQEVGGRALRGAAYAASDMTLQSCTSFCAARGFGIAGLEFGRECYCGNSLMGSATLSLTSTQCYMNCAGGDGYTCGGPGALNIYVNPDQAVATVTLPTGWAYRGCIAEGTSGRALMTQIPLPAGQVSPIACAKAAVAQGFQYAGLEYSTQCWASNSLSNGATGDLISEDRCNYRCPGDGAQFCGGSFTLSLYAAAGAP